MEFLRYEARVTSPEFDKPRYFFTRANALDVLHSMRTSGKEAELEEGDWPMSVTVNS